MVIAKILSIPVIYVGSKYCEMFIQHTEHIPYIAVSVIWGIASINNMCFVCSCSII
jgi:predicted tellurium resistance membrane protein TerC